MKKNIYDIFDLKVVKCEINKKQIFLICVFDSYNYKEVLTGYKIKDKISINELEYYYILLNDMKYDLEKKINKKDIFKITLAINKYYKEREKNIISCIVENDQDDYDDLEEIDDIKRMRYI